jgi:hypothetical protein
VRFSCRFADPDKRDDEITIDVTLTENECRAIRSMVREGDEHVETKAKAMALRHAYKIVPEGFQHIAGSVRQLMFN